MRLFLARSLLRQSSSGYGGRDGKDFDLSPLCAFAPLREVSSLILLVFAISTSSTAFAEYNSLELVKERGVLVAALDGNNLPFSSSTEQPPGFEVEIARKVSDHLGVGFKPYWAQSEHPSFISKLIKKNCDVLFGLPREALSDVKGVDCTKPYFGTGFVLAMRRGETGVHSVADLKGKSVGLESGVVTPHLQGHVPHSYPDQSGILIAVSKGEVSAGYVGAVQAGWLLKNHPEWKVELVKDFVPEDRWNGVITLRKADVELKTALDKVIQQMLADHEIEPILNKYGIPFHPPFK